MSHQNEELLRTLYGRFAEGDLVGVLAMCDDDIVFTVPGKAPTSGQFTKETFLAMIGQVVEISGGSFREEIVELVANDEKGVALLDHSLTREGQAFSYRTDHIWTIREGIFTSWLERPGDQQAFERAWS